MEIYAPDTNFFLQCSSPEHLDWRLVTQSDEIVLLVVREVRKELDRLKSGGNVRRAKRARITSSLLRRFTTEKINEIELRPSGPRVLLQAAPRPKSEAMPPGYPVDSPDERVVAEAYAASASTNGKLIFLSHDTVPLEDASELGLKTQAIPEEWLLEPEPSDLERQLSDVKRRMIALEGRAPNVVIEAPNAEDGVVVLSSQFYPPLSEQFIASAMRAIRMKHPLGANGQSSRAFLSISAELDRMDEERWSKYSEDYRKWLDEIEGLLHDAAQFFTEDPNASKLPLSIANTGAAGAENMIVYIEALGDFHLVDPEAVDDEQDPVEYFPEPPTRPRSSLIDGFMGMGRPFNPLIDDFSSRLSMPRIHTSPLARDRHAIYWDYENDRNARFTEGQCRDFRHGLDADEIELLIERNGVGEETIKGALRVLISAGNLVEAKRLTFSLRIESEFKDTEQLMRELLQRELGVEA